MRRRDIRRANHNFMIGIIGMAIVVMMAVAFFLVLVHEVSDFQRHKRKLWQKK